MNCEWQESDHAITAHKNIQYSNVESQYDCAVQCISTRYATHAFYMTKTLDFGGFGGFGRNRRRSFGTIKIQKCLCIFEHGNLTMQNPKLEDVIEFGSKTDLQTCNQDFIPYTLDMPVRNCFEKGTRDSSCCSAKDGGCEIYDGPCEDDSDCKTGACGLKGFCPQKMYPWENLHPNLEEIRCCSDDYFAVDTPCKYTN